MKLTKRIVSLLLAAMLLVGLLPLSAVAAWADENVVFEGTSFGTNGYYTVISQKEWALVPGAATETEMVLNNAGGSRRQVIHVVEVDPSNPAVSIVPGYYGIDKDITNVLNQSAAGVTTMASYYEDVLGYNVVAGMNTGLAYDNNAPYSWLVYNGNVLVDHKNKINDFHSGVCQTMLCVYKDEFGSCYCELRTAAQGLRGDEWQAIGANFAMVINNGVLVSKNVDRSSAAARSMIGVKEDGTLVLCMNDGRGANNSIGFSDYEEGEAMLALGCKWAFNCDGGGSSSFVTKRAGEDAFAMRCVPCDGAERPTINAVFITSNVGPTGVLNNVNVTSDYDYFAPGTTYTFGAEAIDTHGYAMNLPADLSWQLSDASFGTVENGTFASNGTLGEVTVQAVSGGAVVGEKTVTVVNPATLHFATTETTLPYGKSTTLEFVSKQGEADVYLDGSSFAFNLSEPAAGSLSGLTFTATSTPGVSGTVITATYLPTNTNLTFTVNLGQGSEILWDFEDGDISAWASTDAADQFMRDGGAALTTRGWFTTPFRTLESGGQISWSTKTYTKLSSIAAGGKAHGGDKALAVTFNMKNSEFNSWVYAIIWNIEGNTVLRDVANGKSATRFGCWLYLPKGFYTAKNSGALALQLQVLTGASSTGTLAGKGINLQYNGKNINSLKESDIPENRWIYVSGDLTAYNFVKLSDPLNDVFRSPSIMRMYVKPSEAQELTYYFDDFTLDYSSAVDDRTPPVITSPTYCTYDENIALDGQTITSHTVSFNATVADASASNASGLDYSSAAVYVDGVKYAASASGSSLSLENVELSNGAHSIKFEIADKLGNPTTLTKTLTVNDGTAQSAVRLAGHNDKNNTIEAGSVYYVDLVADAIEDIESVSATIKLQSAHEWEAAHTILADGFTASYSLNSVEDSILTVTVTKTGKTTLTGTQTIASIPVRVWSFDESTYVGGDGKAPQIMTSAQRYASSYGEPVLLVEAKVERGEVGYADNTSGSFYGEFSRTTAVTGNKTQPWHAHDAELTVLNKAATCTEAGYANRTYCETCGSVVGWGTEIPATGHEFAFNTDGVLACTHDATHLFTGTWTDGKDYIDGVLVSSEDGWSGDCYYVNGAKVKGVYTIDGVTYDFGEDGVSKGKYTGLFTEGGYTYYAVAGNLVSGWQMIDGDYYYFNTTNYRGWNGKLNGGNKGWPAFFHAVNGKISEKYVWSAQEDVGTRCYYAGGKFYSHEWATIEDAQYYFGSDGCRYEGYRIIKDSRYSHDNDYRMYQFAEDGKLIAALESTGILESADGIFYLEAGYAQHKGLASDGNGSYYYFDSTFKAIKNEVRYVSDKWANGLLPAGTYTFGADGKLVVKNGIVSENEKLYYYINGQRKHAGLIEIDSKLYYVKTDGEVVTNITRYVDALHSNGYPAGTYTFGEDGAAIIKNGIVAENDKLYFYIDGVRTHAGLIQIGGNYYYAKTGGEIITNTTRYVDARHANAYPAGTYSFGADGAAYVKNGVVDEGGTLYYYVNGAKTHGGLVAVDGFYYYAKTDGSVAVDITRSIDQNHSNGLLEAGVYTFNAYGQIVDGNGNPIPAN